MPEPQSTVTTGATVPAFSIGDVISGVRRPFTISRVGWYSIGMFSAATGAPHAIQLNIHTDADIARSQGLPAPIADGMHTTNWLSLMMSDHFGEHYVLRGSLRTKFIKPTFIDVPITPRGQVRSITLEEDGGIRYDLDIWTEDDKGTKLTVGDASAVVKAEG